MKWGVVLLLIAAVGLGQEPRFGARINEVLVPVSVTTKAGKPVENLTAGDFTVLNDGVAQRVRLISPADAVPLPIDTVIVLQADAGSEPALAKVKKTASVVSSYITNDMGMGAPSLAAVVTTGEELHVVQNFAGDASALGDTFLKLSATGADSNRVVDGVNLACDLLAGRKETARRLVVLISESRDLHSKAHFTDVVLKAQKENIVICTLSYSAFTTAFTQKASDRPPPPDQPGSYDPSNTGGIDLLAIPTVLGQLARANVSEAFAETTGGIHGKFTTLRGLETQLTAIGTDIHNRYTLTFVPPRNQAAGYHKLSVSVRGPGDWRVRARPGYWTTSDIN
jgi:VWFA-related protein